MHVCPIFTERWIYLVFLSFCQGDFNIIVVDWGKGALTDYYHAAANTFVVGAEIVQLLTYLHDNHGLRYSDVHLIGHSLGAQVSGHAGHRLGGIARITGQFFFFFISEVYNILLLTYGVCSG